MQRRFLFALAVLLAALPALSARAETDDERYTIMKPEPWLPPKYQSPRGTRQHVRVPRVTDPEVRQAPRVPPPIVSPQTGRVLPNLPALPGAGPGGAETGQDRALRCAHQAGVYGDAAGNASAYLGSCVNQ